MARVLSLSSSPLAIAAAGAALVRRRGLVAVLLSWGIVAVLSLLAVAPAWAWWTRALSRSIEASRLLGSPNIALLAEMAREDPSAARMILAAAVLASVAAVLLNPFLAGGTLGALARPAGERPAASFGAAGGRHYGAMLRVLLIVGGVACVAVPLVAVAAGALAGASGAAPSYALGAMLVALVAGIAIATVILDAARVQIVRHDLRGAGVALRLVGRVGTPGLLRLGAAGLAFAALLAAAGIALVAIRAWLPGDTMPWILAGLALQQAHALGRTWLRAAWLGAALAYADAVDVPAIDAGAVAAFAASVAPGLEQRPEVLVVVQGEAGEGGMRDDERRGGEDLASEIRGGPPARDRSGTELPPLA